VIGARIDVADSVAELPDQRRGDLHGQALSCARPAGSGKGDQPVCLRGPLAQVSYFRLAPNKNS